MRLQALLLVPLLAMLAAGRPSFNPLHAHMVLGGTMEEQTSALAAHLRMGHLSLPWAGGGVFKHLAPRSHGNGMVVSLRDDPTASLVQNVDHSPVLNLAQVVDYAMAAGRLVVPSRAVYVGVDPPPSEHPPRLA